MEVLYTSLQQNKRVKVARTPRATNNDIIKRLENDNANLLKKIKELTSIKNELETQYEKCLYEKEDTLQLLQGELDFNNEMETKYTELLKKSVSQENMLQRSKNIRSTPKLSRRPSIIPPKKPMLPPKKRRSTGKKSSGNMK